MFIKGSVRNLISTSLSMSRDHGQLNMDSDYSETWRKSPQSNGCREAVSIEKEESKACTTITVELSRTCSELSSADNMCASSSPERDDHVFKRRKLQRNTVALVSHENSESAKRVSGCYSSIDYVDDLFTVSNEDINGACTLVPCNNDLGYVDPSICQWHHLQKLSTVPSSQCNDISHLKLVDNGCSNVEKEVPTVPSASILSKSATEHNSDLKYIHSLSKSSSRDVSIFAEAELDDIGECSSSDILVAEALGEFISARELCISVLKRHGMLGGLFTAGACDSPGVPGVTDAACFRSCKICGLLENAMKLLICDLCEEAFHMSCCNPRIEEVPDGEWYCQPCFRKKPKRVSTKSTTDSFNIVKHRKNLSELISFMLRDDQPYTTGVRIGKDFQVEVPEWSAPVYNDYNCSCETVEVDPFEYASLSVCIYNKPSKFSSIGNWIQCREVIYKGTDDNDEGTICGKWRRAPLFVVQTDDWDCSCAVVWDPFHADCAAPQELDTNVVLKHLKFIEKMRSNANGGPSTKEKRKIIFDNSMVNFFIELMVDQRIKDRRIDGGFTTSWVEISFAFSQKYPDLTVTKNNLRAMLHYIEKRYVIIKKMMEHSGFGWNTLSSTIDVCQEVWEHYVEACPNARRNRHIKFDEYEKLRMIFGDTMVYGQP